MAVRAVIPAFFLAFASVVAAASAQRVLKVPSQYKTIQAAIDAAGNSDTVSVAPGHYIENIDFKGKAITVTSSHGPSFTVLDGAKAGSVVRFVSGESRNSILRGFTVTNGQGTTGGGIDCRTASPTITDNVIDNNLASFGCGVHSKDGSPLIERNTISNNRNGGATGGAGGGIDTEGGEPIIRQNVIFGNSPTGHNGGQGGGIACDGGVPLIQDNVIFDNGTAGIWGGVGGGIWCVANGRLVNNVVYRNDAFPGMLQSGGAGGGVCCSMGTTITNCTIYGNSARIGGGVWTAGGTPVTNSILWQNTATQSTTSQISGTPTVTYSDVQGGWPGTGNLNLSPGFVNTAADDFHLRFDSPLRDRGTNSAPGLTSMDFESDPRIAGGTVDMGADEFFPHLYHTGTPTPGGTIRLKFIGTPGTQAYWGFSRYVLNSPVSIPGLQGLFYLNPSSIAIIGIGRFPSTGYIDLPFKFAPSFPKIPIPMQALAGVQLTNLDVVGVK